jgi:cobalt-zinc-cadmium efflux system outer membrane protein
MYCLLALFSLTAIAQTTLSLREAVSQALSSHPLLAVGTQRIAASEGLRRQAGLRPNPRVVLQTENVRAYGNPGFNFSRDADTFAYFSQTFETAGKRTRRVDAAAANLRRAELERELLARQIGSRVKRAYWYAVGAQRIHELLLETGRTFQQVVDYHEIRVREGAMAEADLLRVRVEGERIAINANTAALDAERARIQLFREMGRAEFPSLRLSESLEDTGVAPFHVEVSRALEDRVEMKLARQGVEQAGAKLRLEQALAKPDLNFLFGYKRASGFHTMVGGVQMDLPLGNRNQGNISATAARVKAGESSLAATEALVRAEISAARADYEMRRRQLLDSLRPLREHASESSRVALAAYREGGSELLRLLDAERTRLEVEILYYRTLAEYRQGIVALETALGVAP